MSEAKRVQEPNWVTVNEVGNPFEQQMDVNSRNGAMRHRKRVFTGEEVPEWRDGPAPR